MDPWSQFETINLILSKKGSSISLSWFLKRACSAWAGRLSEAIKVLFFEKGIKIQIVSKNIF